MTLIKRLLPRLNRLLARFRVELVSRSELEVIRAGTELAEPSSSEQVPAEAERYLTRDNPRLVELCRRYSGHPACSPSRWTGQFVEERIELSRFRADNAFVWSARDGYVNDRVLRARRINYLLSEYYVRSVDELGVLRRSVEDGLFGIPLVLDDEFKVSRDLLDSGLELNFLERHLHLSTRRGVCILDIGAGYGRFAHRAVETLANARVLCADAVPESTFVSEYYLRFRGVQERADVLPLDELDSISPGEVDLALNVHSWSECPMDVIAWWLDLLVDRKVRHLMIVPNDGEQLLSFERDGTRLDFAPLLAERGYRLLAVEPKYGHTSCQRFGIYPTHYHLFAQRWAGSRVSGVATAR